MNIQKANDDGEPTGTAGIPIIENTINKSRFIAHIKPVFSEEEAKMFIEEVKQTHKEATHNCSAYTVGNQMNIQKANDDGEPTGTAGIP
ncbi:YigZ family protein, partial [Streptococcus pneumoniae]